MILNRSAKLSTNVFILKIIYSHTITNVRSSNLKYLLFLSGFNPYRTNVENRVSS